MHFDETPPGHVTSDTPEQIKAATALACACEICVLQNLGPAESGPKSTGMMK